MGASRQTQRHQEQTQRRVTRGEPPIEPNWQGAFERALVHLLEIDRERLEAIARAEKAEAERDEMIDRYQDALKDQKYQVVYYSVQ